MGLVLLIPLPDYLQDLTERNTGDAAHVDGVKRLVDGSESGAVFLAYGTNDAIAYYSQRVTLFYRRIPTWDPATGTHRWGKLEPPLVEAVNRLLERGEPVYYVQDSDPPFADSLNILRRHFDLSPQGGTVPLVYRIQRELVE